MKNVYSRYKIAKYTVSIFLVIWIMYSGGKAYDVYNRFASYPRVKDFQNTTPYNFKGITVYAPLSVIEKWDYYQRLWEMSFLITVILCAFDYIALNYILPYMQNLKKK